MSNGTSNVHAPWGYEYLATQDQANSKYLWQIVQCLTLGGYVWDTILSFTGDWEFVFCRRFNYVTCIYVTNRLAATLCLVGYFVLDTATTLDCEAVGIMVPVTEGITLFTSAALLVIRVWACYREQVYVTIFMIAFLFPGPIINIVVWVRPKSIMLPNNSGCGFSGKVPNWGFLPFLFQAVFDLLVFVLCLGKLLTKNDLSIRAMRDHTSGTGIKLRREFIKGGFVYYIPNLIIQITTLVFLAQANPSLEYITTPCATAVASAQSLRITRKLWKLGVSGQQRAHEFHFRNVDAEKKGCASPEIGTPTSPASEEVSM